MNRKYLVNLALTFVFLPLVLATSAHAQNGTLSGTVVDLVTGTPLQSAIVEVFGGDVTQNTQTDADGRFSLSLSEGNYSIFLTAVGHGPIRVDGVSVSAGSTNDGTYQMPSRSFLLNPIVVTASRRQEKALDAPTSIAVVSAEEIEATIVATPVEHVRSLPGVDLVQTGLTTSNVVARGFNNVFSGALLTIIDNRYAHVPSLRFNAHNMIPTTDLDIARIEVSLGPGAALYGPNASNGVLHILTKSPIDYPGTSISLGGGERSVLMGSFRHASSFNDRFGFKISGQYMEGNDWENVDSLEAAARRVAELADPSTLVGLRDNNTQRFSGEARLDYRAGDSEFILSAGVNQVGASVELTGIGASQTVNWRYKYAQARFINKRFFAQFFINASDAGESYLLRTGSVVEDLSRMLAFQIQHGFDLGESQSFTYGIDLQRTDPRTNGTITGRNEDDDTIDEAGVYVHSETRLTDGIELVAAVRLDDHNRLNDLNFSPRVALVVHPNENSTVRFTFNRSFDTPTTNNLFLDLLSGRVPLPGGAGYDVRVLGVPESGFTFENCAGGFMDLCMRLASPSGDPGTPLPANAVLVWDGLIAAFAPTLAPLLPNPGSAVGTILRRFSPEGAAVGDPFPLDLLGPTPIAQLESSIANTFEVGFKGILGDRLVLAADVYYTVKENFIGPLRVETPTVFLDPATTAAYVTTQLTPLVLAGVIPPELVQALIVGLASYPIGTVTTDQNSNNDLLLTYRNFGRLTLGGVDLSLKFVASDEVTLSGTFSYVSDDCFDGDEDGVVTPSCNGSGDVALNAPKTKGSISARWTDVRSGLTVNTRVRYSASFPMNSGVFVGTVESYAVFDVSASYNLSWVPGVRVSVTVTNIGMPRGFDGRFSGRHREFIGAPEIGRLVLGRVNYSF